MEAAAALAQFTGSAEHRGRYRAALLDWLACAAAGTAEPAAQAADAAAEGLLGDVTWAGCAGHVLDFDDTYLPGLVHASAAAAPAALLVAAERGRDLDAALDAYATGFEVAAALARAGHPALYDRGWHPTAVCGTAGAAAAAGRLLGLDPRQAQNAIGLALLRAAGLRAAFGTDGKSLQVGMAAAAGVQVAQLAWAGARAPAAQLVHGPGGFEDAFGSRWPAGAASAAVLENWIKAYPCCLATHGAIEAAESIRRNGPLPQRLVVHVHPVARQAAQRDDVEDGLQAKFSIPYVTAFTLLYGAPAPAAFAGVDERARALARTAIEVRTDLSLAEMETRLTHDGEELARVTAATGSPARPMTPEQLTSKVRALAGERLDGVLDDGAAPAAAVLAAAGLRG